MDLDFKESGTSFFSDPTQELPINEDLCDWLFVLVVRADLYSNTLFGGTLGH
jgi:hypothetical protein